MHKNLRIIALSGAIAMASAIADAIELPVKSINGHRYYYYEVKYGDTVYSLANKFGISRDDIIRHNPGAADGLRAGNTLYFPYEDFAEAGSKAIRHEVKRGETLFGLSHRYGVTPDDIVAMNPHTKNGLKSGDTILIPVSPEAIDSATQHAAAPNETPVYVPAPVETPAQEEDTKPQAPKPEPTEDPIEYPAAETTEAYVNDNTAETADDMDAEEDIQVRDASIAVLLPFALEQDTPSKHAQLYTDFYKGMLLAAEEKSKEGQPVSIRAYDSNNFAIDTIIAGASVIIAPEDAGQINALTAAVDDNEGYVLNIFNLKDESYLTSPSLVQANIPHAAMYAKAYEGMRERFGNLRPVLLHNNNGRNEKSAFIDFIREKYIADGIAPIEVKYNGTLRSSDLDILDAAEGSRYVVVPSSGTLAEFNKMSHALKAFRNDPSTASVEIFGYPDWIAFRNDALDMLRELGATIYTRVFIDPEGEEYKNLSSEFKSNYGEAPMEVVPNQAVLGYDTASMLIDNLRENGGLFTPDGGKTWQGKQSVFRLERPSEDSGFVNNALFIVTFHKDRTTQCTVI